VPISVTPVPRGGICSLAALDAAHWDTTTPAARPERGELTIRVEYVPRVWEVNKAEKPRSAAGRTFLVEGVFGKLLDNLLLIKPGETMEVEVQHQRGDRFRFPGEWLQKAAAFDPEKYPIPPDEFRGFRGILTGEVVAKFEESGSPGRRFLLVTVLSVAGGPAQSARPRSFGHPCFPQGRAVSSRHL
jgi:hypothetical protein